MAFKPDITLFNSQLPQYVNIGEPTGNITISGTVVNGGTGAFSVFIATDAATTRSDIFGTNLTTGVRQLLSNSTGAINDSQPIGGIYQHTSSETASVALFIQSSPKGYTIEIDVFNGTGGSITLINQTIKISIVEYALPF